MTSRQFSIDVGPTNETYRSLLRIAPQWCSQGILVVRPHLGLGAGAKDLIGRLQPFVVEDSSQTFWPGTTLLEGVARVLRFRLDERAISLLLECSSGLYDWRQPDLPEDLCLLRASGEPWLVTISHECDGYVALSDTELASLRADLPAFADLLVEDVVA